MIWLNTDLYDPRNKIERLLNSEHEASSIADDYSAQKVGGSFINSGIKLILNNPKTKIFVTALHVPDGNTGKIHHFKIQFYKFKHKNKDSGWAFEQTDTIDDKNGSEAINKLHEFIVEQSKIAQIALNDYSQYDMIKSKKRISATELEDYINEATVEDTVIIQRSALEKIKSTRLSEKNIKQYETNLENFRKLVQNPGTTETHMQNFLKNHVWFFGLDYIQAHGHSKPKFSTALGSEYDFLLEGFNQIYDIAELKGPNSLLIEEHSKGKRKGAFDDRIDYRYSTEFSRALHQVTSYMYEFETSFGHIKENQPTIKSFMYPKSTIIISKRDLFASEGKDAIKYLHLLSRQFANIEILNYDDLGDRAQNIIDFIKRSGNNK